MLQSKFMAFLLTRTPENDAENETSHNISEGAKKASK
jgi:hypothetical protein